MNMIVVSLESPNNPSTFLVEELGMNEEELATFKKKLDFGKKRW